VDPQYYLPDAEQVKATVSARSSEYHDEKGTLVCTARRVIFAKDQSVLDISLYSVDAIKYSRRSHPWFHYTLIFIGLAIGAATWARPGPLDSSLILPLYFLAAGILIPALFMAIWRLRQRELELYTPSGNYKFTSRTDELETVAQLIRRYEAD